MKKRTYYELAKAAVSEEHRLTEHGLDGTRGPVWARQIEMVNTNLLEPGQYREICTLAATTNYRALKWINYKKLSSRDFVDIFMTTATKYSEYKWQNMNPAVYYLLDANVPSTLLEDCYMEFANKFGIDTLKADFKTCKNLATLNMLDRIEQRLLARQKS